MEVVSVHLKVMVSAWKAWLAGKDVTGDWRSEKGCRKGRVYFSGINASFDYIVWCGVQVGNVVC